MKNHLSLKTIPNRHSFFDYIRKEVTNDPCLSLLFIDVVRFSDVSASFGYETGDQILTIIANRIERLFGSIGALGRISGDIFGLVIKGKHSERELREFYRYLTEHFKTPIAVQDHSFIADFNVGAIANNQNNSDTHMLFSRAESALKQAKENRYENFFTMPLFGKSVTGRSLALKADLKRAFANDELELYFQPKVNLNNLDIVGAECLLRWNHPLDGVLFPGALIEAAESYNMMNEVGYWVLEKAFESAAFLKSIGLELQISVNISPTQLYDTLFVSKVGELGTKYGVDLKNMELELTEDVALSNSLMTKRQLSEVRALGLSIAVDDFGKGYSNLAYMRDLQLDTIKIDKTFVLGLGNNAVNRAIIEATQLIGSAMKSDVTAEGIESVQHLHTLREIGIETGQGFLFSKALPIKEFMELTQRDLIVGSSLAYNSRKAS
jgi:diguanylate cyclase (GGDEF)-like protein